MDNIQYKMEENKKANVDEQEFETSMKRTVEENYLRKG